MDDDKKLKMAYKSCKLLNIECIEKELEDQLEGYTFKSIEVGNGEWIAHYEDLNNAYIIVTISFNKLSVLKETDNKIERIIVDENRLLTDRVIDKRSNGIIYTIIQKQFASSSRFNQIVLTDLVEQRFTFTKDSINNIYKSASFDNIRLATLLLKLRMLESKVSLKSQSDFYSEFSTYMNYYFNIDGNRKTKNDIYPTRTYLNGEDVSSIFDIDGPDKLYRIYDLYNGIVNSRDENDINSINLGFLPLDAFNLKELKGINKQEDSLVGASLERVTNSYKEYLKNFFD